jgi:hypothetical protein
MVIGIIAGVTALIGAVTGLVVVVRRSKVRKEREAREERRARERKHPCASRQ